LVRASGPELALDEIVSNPNARHADRGAAAFAAHHPADRGLAHQPLDAFASDVDAVRHGELGVDAR
jgi:hypothetical protein